MVALLILAFAVATLAETTSTSKCPYETYLLGGKCYYIDFYPNLFEKNATEGCEQNYYGNYIWRLPELDGNSQPMQLRNYWLKRMQEEKDAPFFFWIGFVREEAVDEMEATDLKRWHDPSKWRWRSNDSTLDYSFNGSPPNWGHRDNQPFEDSSRTCAYAEVNVHSPMVILHDFSCEHKVEIHRLKFIVCESNMEVRPLPPWPTWPKRPFRPEIDRPSVGSTQQPKSMDRWKWGLLGGSIAVAIVGSIAVIVVIVLIRRRRQKHKSSRRLRGDETSDSSSLGLSNRSSNKKKTMRSQKSKPISRVDKKSKISMKKKVTKK